MVRAKWGNLGTQCCAVQYVTADGSLKTCLFGSDSVSLRDALRSGVSDRELGDLIQGALLKKHFKHGGHDNVEGVARNAFENRPMVKIGG